VGQDDERPLPGLDDVKLHPVHGDGAFADLGDGHRYRPPGADGSATGDPAATT
jgi:hypothetical protein